MGAICGESLRKMPCHFLSFLVKCLQQNKDVVFLGDSSAIFFYFDSVPSQAAVLEDYSRQECKAHHWPGSG